MSLTRNGLLQEALNTVFDCDLICTVLDEAGPL